MNTVYITYNPHSEVEQTLAVRLHTIGAVNGFKMLLPDRFSSEHFIDNETKVRIEAADWFVLFLTQQLSPIVQQEINYAISSGFDLSRIIVIYNPQYPPQVAEQIVMVPFDLTTISYDEVAQDVLLTITRKIRLKMETQNQQKNGIIALLGIGLGLLALDAFSTAQD